jgi:isopentenyl-diphosphate delta-isomerase
MTGGTDLSAQINRNLAVAAQELRVAIGVGSQRLGIEKPNLAASFQVREVAPDIPLLANLGAVYLNYGYGLEECERVVEMIGADALTLYLNPMQKIFQGDRGIDFKGLVDKIAHICQHLSVPVMVKEVGFGLSADSAMLLKKAGAHMLDVAGAGGTSWVKITRHLKGAGIDENPSAFDGWGIPTADSLVSVKKAVPDIPIIASGGIRSGNDMAKALALGADYAGMALPLLSHAMESSEAVIEKIATVIEELKIAMFGCGAANLRELKNGQFIRQGVRP